MSAAGQCLCGALQYEIDPEPKMAVVCHCKNCQRQAGSAFSTIVGTTLEDFRFTRGAPKEYVDTDTASGNTVRRFFCADCGSPIYSALDAQPGAIYVKSGTLNDTSGFAPQAHVWCDSKQGWLELDAQVPQLAKQS